MNRIVKICGLTDPKNILDVIQLKPDWIGLIFYHGSTRCIADPAKLSFLNNLPGRPLTVAVFVDPHLDEIIRVTSILNIDVIQLHGSESPAFCQILRESDYKVMKAFSIHIDFDFRLTAPYRGKTDFFLFDTRSPKPGGSGEQFDWNLLKDYHGETSFLLSGGISPDTHTIPNHSRLNGVDLNSRFETSPGIKDILLLKNFINHYRYE
jgi:phosphoribosylanthranilate isomerase